MAILDSGAGLTTMSESVAARLQEKLSVVLIISGMDESRQLTVADGHVLQVAQRTYPVPISLHTNWGPVVVDLFSFAVMPGNDNVVILVARRCLR